MLSRLSIRPCCSLASVSPLHAFIHCLSSFSALKRLEGVGPTATSSGSLFSNTSDMLGAFHAQGSAPDTTDCCCPFGCRTLFRHRELTVCPSAALTDADLALELPSQYLAQRYGATRKALDRSEPLACQRYWVRKSFERYTDRLYNLTYLH